MSYAIIHCHSQQQTFSPIPPTSFVQAIVSVLGSRTPQGGGPVKLVRRPAAMRRRTAMFACLMAQQVVLELEALVAPRVTAHVRRLGDDKRVWSTRSDIRAAPPRRGRRSPAWVCGRERVSGGCEWRMVFWTSAMCKPTNLQRETYATSLNYFIMKAKF